MALQHVDVDNPELHGEDRQGHRRLPEDELIVVDVLRWSRCVALWEIKLNLCDAVGDDRGDDGDVHDIDEDDKQVAPAVWRRGEEGTVPSRAV